jgi:hypothetical protein
MAKLTEGDVFEIEDAGDFYYIQFLGKHADREIIAVIPQSFTASVADFEKLKGCGVIYPVFYPLRASLRHKLSRFVGHSPLFIEFPTVFRRPGRVEPGPHVANWFIDEADGKTRVVDSLSEEEKWIPVAEGWNHEMLIKRIKSKWHPTMWV